MLPLVTASVRSRVLRGPLVRGYKLPQACALPSHISGLQSVSYTHLDVYKRQLESRGNGGELRVQVGAEPRDGGDDRNRDEAREEAVFNGRNASLIFQKTREKILH